MIYEKCPSNHDEIDIYEINDLGFMELVYCANKAKEEKEIVRY